MRIKTLLLVTILSVSTQAQITITDATFPQAGDILETNLSLDSTTTISAPSSQSQLWDFSGLVVFSNDIDTVEAASNGASYALFPTADILQELFPGFGGIAYVDVTSSQIVRIGGAFEFFGIAFANPYSNSHITQEVPLTYPDNQSDDYEISLAAHIDSIPFLRTLLDSISPTLSATADSIRLRFEGEENREVDAFGNCTMIDGSYDVIRQKTMSVVTAAIEIRLGGFGFYYWQDLSALFGSALPIDLPNNDTTVYYDYLSTSLKQPLARFYTDSTLAGVDRVVFYQGDSLSSTISIEKIASIGNVVIYPNPSDDQIQISMEKFDNPVQVSLIDPTSRIVLQKQVNSHQVSIDIKHLSAAFYHVIFRDQKGHLLGAQKIQKR